MSSFLCGALELVRPHTPREAGELGLALAGFALEEHLGLQLGCAVVQPLVLEILGLPRAFDGSRLPFLVTNSPIWDTSEAVVDKYAPEYPNEEPDGPLPARLARVQRFLVRAMALPGVARGVVIVCAGAGAAYHEEEIRADQLVDRLLPRYEDVLDVPDVRFSVAKG